MSSASVYLARRMQITGGAPVSVATQAALANSALTDDQLEEARALLGGPAVEDFGLGDLVNEWVTRAPVTETAGSVREIQTSLVAQGFLPREHPIDGIWSPVVNSAFNRAQRAETQSMMTGDRPGSASVPTLIRWLDYTVPGKVWQGVVGTVKGTFSQFGEAAKRQGVITDDEEEGEDETLPRAASMAIGGLASRILLDDEEDDADEAEREARRSWVENLNPYASEGGGRAFLEDLDLLLTISAVGKGAKLAATGIKGGATAIRAGGALAKPAGAVAQPGVGKALATALKGNVVAGGATGAIGGLLSGQDLGGIAQGAGIGAGASLILGRFKAPGHWADKWLDFTSRRGLAVQLQRPLLKAAQQVYTGASITGIGGRLFGGALVEGDTTIEKAISEAKPLTTFAVPGVGGDALDWSLGMLLYPTQILPFKAGEVARTANSLLGEAHLEPLIRTLQRSIDPVTGARKTLSRGEARRQIWQLGDSNVEVANHITYLRLDAALDHEVVQGMKTLFKTAHDPIGIRERATELRSALVRQIHAEGLDGKTAKRLLASTFEDDTILEAHLASISGRGSGIERMVGYRDASRLLDDAEKQWHAGQLPLTTGATRWVTGGDVDTVVQMSTVKAMKAHARQLSKDAKARALTTEARKALVDESNQLVKAARELEKNIKRPKAVKDFKPHLMAARDDYLTREQLHGMADDYESLAQNYTRAEGNWRKDVDNDQAYQVFTSTEQALYDFVDNLEAVGALEGELAKSAKQPKFLKGVSNHLRRYGDLQASEVVGLPQRTVDQLSASGYKAVATGEDVIKLGDVPRILEVTGVNDYSRRQAFFATIRNMGIDPRVRSDEALFNLRAGYMAQELEHTAQLTGLRMRGNKIVSSINRYLHERNDPRVLKEQGGVTPLGPFIVRGQGGGRFPKVELFKVDPRELTVDDFVNALELERRAPDGVSPHVLGKKLYDAMHRGSALGGEAHILPDRAFVRDIMRVMGVSGLQGASDWIRTWHIKDPRKAAAALGGGAGALIGGEQDDGSFSLSQALASGVAGAAAGYGLASVPSLRKLLNTKFTEGTYGYLPQKLHRVNMAVRYTLSPTFDAGRYVEQYMLGALHGANSRPIIRPHNFIAQREWKSPYRAGTITGESAWKDAVRFWDELNGTTIFGMTDDLERRAFQIGLFGFSPRHHEAAQALVLFNKGVKREEIIEKVYKIGRYGLGRSALEKTANFIFFPFSFQKKLLAAWGDWMFSAPARALLVHEGFRRWHEYGASEDFANFADAKLPILDELAQINNLAFGASPGRFFLEGIAENKTEAGEAAQILSSFFVPSGAATPLAQAAGKAADRTVHAFVPVVVTGENIPGLMDIMESFAPLPRDIEDYIQAAQGQTAAIFEGAEPYYQQTAYLDAKRALDGQFDYLAQALGYKNLQSFRSSDKWPLIEPLYDREEFALRDQYPSGAKLADEFTNTTRSREKTFFDLANSDDRSAAEDVIVSLSEIEQAGKALARDANVSYGEVVYPFVLRSIRQAARQHQDDQRFRSLYATYFQDDFGPIEEIAA